MPLLGATLIAILSFLPIFLSPDTAGVYVRDLFIVLAVSLLLSWILALVHVPLMADRWLKQPAGAARGERLSTAGSTAGCAPPSDSACATAFRRSCSRSGWSP